MKTCTKCGVVKPPTEFNKSSRNKNGLRAECRECQRQYRTENLGFYLEYDRIRRLENPQRCVGWIREWKVRNREACTAYQASRRSRERLFKLTQEQQDEVRQLYTIASQLSKLTNHKWHVDHIVPLHGENVSGLHVPWNLRAVPAIVNMKKGNKHV